MYTELEESSIKPLTVNASSIYHLIKRIEQNNEGYRSKIKELNVASEVNITEFKHCVSNTHEIDIPKKIKDITKELDEVFQKDRNNKLNAIILEKNYLNTSIYNLNILTTELYKRKYFFINIAYLITRLGIFIQNKPVGEIDVKKFFYKGLLEFINSESNYLSEINENAFLSKFMEFFVFPEESFAPIEKIKPYEKIDGKWNYHTSENHLLSFSRLTVFGKIEESLDAKYEKQSLQTIFINPIVDINPFISVNEGILQTNIGHLVGSSYTLVNVLERYDSVIKQYKSPEFKKLIGLLSSIISDQYNALLEIEGALDLHYKLIVAITTLYHDTTQYKHLSILNNILAPISE